MVLFSGRKFAVVLRRMQFDTRRVEKVHERCSKSSGLWLGAARTIAELAIHQSDSENILRKL